MKAVVLSVAVALAVGSVVAHADPYAGVNLTKVNYKEDGFDTASPTALTFRLGNQFNQNLAVEGRLGLGLSEDQVEGITVELDRYFGVYAKAILPASETFSIYGLVGYTDGDLTFSIPGFSLSSSDSDFSFGFGVDIQVSKTVILNAEFAQLVKGDGFEVEGVSFGLGFKF